MGQIVKQMSSHTTRYYWYPGEKKEWMRGVFALIAGAGVYIALHLITHGTLLPAVAGTSVAAGYAGFNFGRRDSRELARFADLAKSRYVRRQTAVHTGRAVWRGIAEGTGGAAAAVIIVNLRQHGFVVDWLLPLVPAVIGALAHQGGMMVERLGRSASTAGPAAERPAVPVPAEAPAPTDVPVPVVEPTSDAPVGADPLTHVVGIATVPHALRVRPVFAAPGSMRLPAVSVDSGEPVLLRFSPEADCGTVAAARNAALNAMTASGSVAASGNVATSGSAAAVKGSVLTPYHAAVALPPNVTTYKHAKPPMPLSAALANRADLAHVVDALGHESLTESHLHSS